MPNFENQLSSENDGDYSDLEDWENDTTEITISELLENDLINRLMRKEVGEIQKDEVDTSKRSHKRNDRKYYCPSFLQNKDREEQVKDSSPTPTSTISSTGQNKLSKAT